jgi:hypothetical protein
MIHTIDITTPALLFSTVSLVMLAYTNRFLALAKLIRDLNDKNSGKPDRMATLQIQILFKRVKLVKRMQFLCVSALLISVLSMLSVLVELSLVSGLLFVIALVLLSASLLYSVWEISLSTQALGVSLHEMRAQLEGGPRYRFYEFKGLKQVPFVPFRTFWIKLPHLLNRNR